jgi:hypothetical protein
MKKILLLSLSVLFLSGCSDKNNYEAAVLAELERDAKNAGEKDYKIPNEKMAECIVEATSQNMHGIFALDPERLMAYRHYTKMLTVAQSPDPKKTMEELRNDFGSVKELVAARSNYVESHMECESSFVVNTEPAESEK